MKLTEGIISKEYILKDNTSEEDLLILIDKLNDSDEIEEEEYYE